jgi:hypothetical protein
MTTDEAVKKGFLALTDDEASQLLETLFDTEDAQQRLDDGFRLLLTFIPEDKIPSVMDLATIVLDAEEELASYEEMPENGDPGEPA